MLGIELSSPRAIFDIWPKSFLLREGGGGGGLLKITCPQCKEFLVLAYINFLIVAYKNEPPRSVKIAVYILEIRVKILARVFQ